MYECTLLNFIYNINISNNSFFHLLNLLTYINNYVKIIHNIMYSCYLRIIYYFITLTCTYLYKCTSICKFVFQMQTLLILFI